MTNPNSALPRRMYGDDGSGGANVVRADASGNAYVMVRKPDKGFTESHYRDAGLIGATATSEKIPTGARRVRFDSVAVNALSVAFGETSAEAVAALSLAGVRTLATSSDTLIGIPDGALYCAYVGGGASTTFNKTYGV